MAKTASVTVRIPEELKRNLEHRALREHRSLSAQIEHELTVALSDEPGPGRAKAGKLLGRFAGRKLPADADMKAARATLWSRLADR
jgi:plasmid stability protein